MFCVFTDERMGEVLRKIKSLVDLPPEMYKIFPTAQHVEAFHWCLEYLPIDELFEATCKEIKMTDKTSHIIRHNMLVSLDDQPATRVEECKGPMLEFTDLDRPQSEEIAAQTVTRLHIINTIIRSGITTSIERLCKVNGTKGYVRWAATYSTSAILYGEHNIVAQHSRAQDDILLKGLKKIFPNSIISSFEINFSRKFVNFERISLTTTQREQFYQCVSNVDNSLACSVLGGDEFNMVYLGHKLLKYYPADSIDVESNKSSRFSDNERNCYKIAQIDLNTLVEVGFLARNALQANQGCESSQNRNGNGGINQNKNTRDQNNCRISGISQFEDGLGTVKATEMERSVYRIAGDLKARLAMVKAQFDKSKPIDKRAAVGECRMLIDKIIEKLKSIKQISSKHFPRVAHSEQLTQLEDRIGFIVTGFSTFERATEKNILFSYWNVGSAEGMGDEKEKQEKEKEKDNEAAQLKLNIVEKLLPRAKEILETLKDSKTHHAHQNENQNHPASIRAIIEAMEELEKLDIGLYSEVLSSQELQDVEKLYQSINKTFQCFAEESMLDVE